MGEKYHLTAHARHRIHGERTVLFMDEVLDIIENVQYIKIKEYPDSLHLLFYSPVDAAYYVLIIAKDTNGIKTVLPLQFYTRSVSEVEKRRAKALTQGHIIYLIAELQWIAGKRRGESYTVGLGGIEMSDVRDLSHWIVEVPIRDKVNQLLAPHLSTKKICLGLWLGQNKKKLKQMELRVPWN